MKGLEVLKNTIPLAEDSEFYIIRGDYLETIEKELKALEIIEKKGFTVKTTISAYVIDVDSIVRSNKYIITKQEYDLLKEVLKNE